MSSKLPPVPPQNQSTKRPVDPRHAKATARAREPGKQTAPDKQGQQGNSWINTHHQGYQQDR